MTNTLHETIAEFENKHAEFIVKTGCQIESWEEIEELDNEIREKVLLGLLQTCEEAK